MAARIVEGLATCSKRWALEDALEATGHKWKRRKGARDPMSALEILVRLLCFVDKREDPSGRLFDVTPESLERAAAWTGVAGALFKALLFVGWLDETPEGVRWHDYRKMNAESIKQRNKRNRGAVEPPDGGGLNSHPMEGGLSAPHRRGMSGSGSGENPQEGSPSERARVGASPRAAPEPEPELPPFGPDDPRSMLGRIERAKREKAEREAAKLAKSIAT